MAVTDYQIPDQVKLFGTWNAFRCNIITFIVAFIITISIDEWMDGWMDLILVFNFAFCTLHLHSVLYL